MSAFEWYASLVISPPIPSSESWTLSEKVAGISQAACRRKPGQGGQEGQVDSLAADASVSRLSTPAPCPGEGNTKQAIDLARIDSKSAVYRSPAQSPQSLILTDAELDRGRSTVLHLTSNLPHSALSSVKFWAKWTDDAILLFFKRCTTGVSSDFSIPYCVVLYPERW